jgi:hypothetical protein
MPRGSMSPQGRSESGAGVARWIDQVTAPSCALKAYTVSFSVAT